MLLTGLGRPGDLEGVGDNSVTLAYVYEIVMFYLSSQVAKIIDNKLDLDVLLAWHLDT